VISFSFGIPYEAMLGHRGLTHSLVFAVLVGFIVARLGFGIWGVGFGMCWVWFAAVTASHGLLDALTNGGRGIAFFAPFSDHRYFFPWRPIQVSPIGVGFFSARGLRVLASEGRWIWLPSAIIAASARVLAHVHRSDRGRPPLLRELRRAGGGSRRAEGSVQDRP
jgi:inner membrane protein